MRRWCQENGSHLQQWFAVTQAFWQEWQLFNYYRGRYEKIVRRSAITLKLLTYARTGAFVAAATTSLPERIGGDQNWDYRYLWVRDTALFISAFFRLGYSGEAKAFFNFIVERCATHVGRDDGQQERHDHPLQVLYPIRKGSSTEERTLDHLAGYRLSHPVRIGNRAAGQFQLDNPAYLLQSFY